MNEHLNSFYQKAREHNDIANDLFRRYDIKKGLRNEDGTGVRVGLTKIADVVGYKYVEEVKTDDIGRLYYRGIELRDIIHGRNYETICGYEETCFLLLFGYLPKEEELKEFCAYLRAHYELPDDFLESKFLHMPGKNLMNRLQQAVLALYDYDDAPDNISVENTLEQGLNILAKLPSIICYAYQSKMHRYNKESLVIHPAQEHLSIAENILYMLRKDHAFSTLEAKLLDMMLIVHADHGGGNNSTFTNVVISSTGTDFYSSMVGAIGSMKGPRHGGANLKVSGMMKAVIEEIGYCENDIEIKALIYRILHKQFYDYSGLVYGMGHAIYTLSDPRSEVLQEYIEKLAEKKGRVKEYEFYQRFEQCAKEVILDVKGVNVSSNVDFYSGFVYSMMGIPEDLFTPLFVMARTVGWLAHNIENKEYDGRIMRPATKYVGSVKQYVKMEDR
ncbi:citrate synthase [Erysipelotrichaceae bacterium AF15-26LB]|mgnify:FL=1|nr:citrate (Si)-synthase [Erysipelotrichaceae bacterium 3_1_53]MCR0349567.1 citrate synthase [[Clostridium] innocuum]RJV86488.1 citrate synthase [Erysipelotrichaceae bacterium AF15-26LB]RJV89594.1 citrate synthase [Erysipelotrichaceae bacterium AF19-24AC]